ncbi:type IX secretion system sortase PorU [Gracilimonas sediminicola]|uniref:type IX secretion system sortase PorU n=1 Tax=Gracilimonas sediminicola TaxID=2952158 RepID=UPI0038D3ABA7
MLNKLLYISGLLCLLIAEVANAQQLKVVAETDSFTDYEFSNETLDIMSPYGMMVPVSGNTPRYQVLEQAVSTINREISPEQATVLALSDNSKPLIEISEPGIQRGQKVSALSINIARYGESGTKVLRKFRIRVYKEGDTRLPQLRTAKQNNSSLFDEGAWYKIPITKNGIYELDATYLEDLGIEVSAIDPRNIQLWGTGGYQLPEANDQPRPELTQIPVIVEGQSDGTFNTSDRIIFYGNSPHQVLRDSLDFEHRLHPYSNESFVFLTVSDTPGERLTAVNNNLSPSRTITSFYDFSWKDEELYKTEESLKSGRYWFGRRFDASSNGTPIPIFSDTLAGIIPNEPITVEAKFINRSTSSANFEVSVNNQQIETVNIRGISCRSSCGSCYNCSSGDSGVEGAFSTNVSPTIQNGIIEAEATYNHNESSSRGFLDWFRVIVKRELQAQENRLFFYSPADGAASELVQYRLSGFDSQPIILDVSNVTQPRLLSSSGANGNYSFNYYSGDDLRFAAQSSFFQPAMGALVPPQNLKGITDYPDYIIVTSDIFREYAEDLGNYRAQKDGLNPVIVTQEQILNEFSGGVLDPSAIRDYTKFLYDRALNDGQEPPKYLLFFGDATFDYKNIISNGFQNYIITYQSIESLNRIQSFATDDFFGFLDDNEGDLTGGQTSNSHYLDIGLGRISAQTRSEAAIAVQKIKTYEDPANTGSWQNLLTFAADDDFPQASDRDIHVVNADETAQRMNFMEPGLRIKKVYEFAYPVEITGSGRKIPGATDAFISSFNEGTLVMNYSGHGNEQTLSDEELFLSNYIPNLTNRDQLAVLVTATCQFGRYDDIDAQSGAEKLLFAENGGIIGAFTTTRVVFTSFTISAGNNFGLNVALSQRMVERNPDGSPLRLGDIYLRTKNSSIGSSTVVASRNSKKFILIGDPATKFRLPEQQADLTSINGYTETGEDTTLTIKALEQVNLAGQIKDLQGNPLPNYSGEAVITVMDAPRNVPLPSDREWVAQDNCRLSGCDYESENDILFKGKAAITNGQFTSSFIVPKDISFSDNTGRIIFFANSNGQTAGGSYTKVRFDGVNENAVDDGSGPQMDVFLNDERFVNGNLVNSSPTLIIELEDQSGINTTGTGVGHEIIATIDTEPQQSFVLNDFYEGSLNDFTRGRIEYPLDQLPEGSYTLKVRAWDVHNNPSEEEVFFEVASSEELTVRNVFNFPNPMNNATRFSFEHNQPGNPLDVSVRIYTLSGKPVQHIEQSLITTSSYASISWDGRDRDYDRLGNGTYIYVLRVATNTPKGRQTAEQVEKLVIIR